MKIKLISFTLCVLFLSSCNSDEDITNSKPEQASQKHYSLGAKLVDEKTFNSYKKADINALTLKFKGKSYEASKNSLPSSYSIPSSRVGDQGKEGSCVAWATAYAAASSLELNFKGITQSRSPEYVYNQIKVGTCEQGAYVTAGLNLIKDQGVCSWDEMPYTDDECSTQPNNTQKSAASNHKFTSWATVDKTDIAGVKNLLSMNLPIIIAVNVDQSFYDMGSKGWVWKSHYGKSYGGHAICVIGYDDNKKAFKVQNSWGSSWGSNGFFWIDYNFFAKTFNGAIIESYVAYVQ
ncbi:C1 family peptidase [Chryseobacterium sp. Chry.R1]|uniref:C1 family peptidase n=1 Tax=Chryseobacterium sp. Chry.R1 TaxID=3139392 RepID=UPI0031F9DBBC